MHSIRARIIAYYHIFWVHRGYDINRDPENLNTIILQQYCASYCCAQTAGILHKDYAHLILRMRLSVLQTVK